MVAACEHLSIVRLQYLRPSSISRFVRAVYSFDYAPFHHLKAKTRYLLKTPPLVLLVFVENHQPDEEVVGDGVFRHIESARIRGVKEAIRDRFNDRHADRRTENHVVHASDNETQTDQILRHIGFPEGTQLFRSRPNPIIDAVYHLRPFSSFRIERVPLDRLFCRVLCGTPTHYELRPTPIAATPQTAFLDGRPAAYREYLSTFQGWQLTDFYSEEKFERLAQSLDYSRAAAKGSFVIAEPSGAAGLAVLDGAHRAAILRSRGIATAPVAIVL